MKRPKAIHQFTPSIHRGDSVSNALFFIQKLLKDLGFESHIYVATQALDRQLQQEIDHIKEYQESKENILLYHHSIGHTYHDEIMHFLDRRVIVYHNITPPHFFKNNQMLQNLCTQGREQLASSAKYFDAAIADSTYNTKELRAYGYKNPKTLPLLLDLDKQERYMPNKALIQKYHATYNIIFVGRIVQNKMQHQLIDTMFALKNKGIKKCKLFIIGGASQPEYMQFLQEYRKNLGLEKEVTITGKVSNEDLIAYYELADLYISLSEHEGFGMPIIEAMRYDTPVLAYNAGGIATTVVKEGLLEKKAPSHVADKIIQIQKDPYFRCDLLQKQKQKLQTFSYENTKQNLIDFLNEAFSLNLQNINNTNKPKKTTYQLEGPFDSSYSLAIVNRELAKALSAENEVKLYATEGAGDFEANLQNVSKDIQALATKKLKNIDITIRNLYPPRTNAMRGYHKIIGPYGWEESKFPKEYVNWFNTKLTMVFAMSEYVKNVLRDNGVYTPIVTTGIIANGILQVEAKPLYFELPSGFKLLHVSSAFARKGVNILLEAFDMLEQKDISLIIKTFPNPHNNTLQQLQNRGYTVEKSYAENVTLYKKQDKTILLINKEITAAELKYLYENTDVLVAPSFGEGFGLPMAEAMLVKLPVITTAYGGQSDFCTDETAFLVDFDFAYAQTHMKLKNSLWAVPKVDALTQTITQLYTMPKEQLHIKTERAKEYILQNYTPIHVSKKIYAAIKNYAKNKPTPNIGLVSTYNTRCGIALYAKHLICEFQDQVEIFAPYSDTLQEEDTSNVQRCWQEGRETQEIALLKQAILRQDISHLIIQYNFSFLPLVLLQELLEFCTKNHIKTYLFLHSTKDVIAKNYTDSFSTIAKALQKVTKIHLHTLEDMNYLKEFGIYKNTYLFTHGIDTSLVVKPQASHKELPTIATFGFLLPQKRILELVEIAQELHVQNFKVNLLLLTAIHPAPISKELEKELKQKIKNSPIKEYITLNTDFLEEKDIVEQLSQATKILFFYDKTQESSSAAVRTALLAQKEIITTPSCIFDDIKELLTQSKDFSKESIIETIKTSLQHPYSPKKQQDFLQKNSWKNISQTFYNAFNPNYAIKN